jgi:deoxycytidine triphosphate deaminase/addiction module HigA family antidote
VPLSRNKYLAEEHYAMLKDFRGTEVAKLDIGRNFSPGEHLRAEIDRLGLDQVAVSSATGVSRQLINNIVNDRQPISRAMAGKLGRLTGRSSDYWLRASFPRVTGESSGVGLDKPVDEERSGRPLGVGILVNHQISRAVRDGIIGIKPFEEKNVQLASIDLTLGQYINTMAGEKIDIANEQGYVLKGGQTVLVGTKEEIQLPPDYIGRVGAMAELARFGIVTLHGFQVDPGFQGHLYFCIYNAAGKDLRLFGDDPIISLEFMPLSATPAPDERAAKHLREASDPEKVVLMFRSDVCGRLIREAVRGCVSIDILSERFKAVISELDIETFDSSADAALDAAVRSALSGLKTLRDKPNLARDDHQKYMTFFNKIAEGLLLGAEHVQHALSYLGLAFEKGDTLIVSLRDGTQVMLPLPVETGAISLRHFARQLRENPLDLILMLTGL